MCNDLTLGICINPQAQIDIDIQNIGGSPVTGNGGIFCLPWSGKQARLSARPSTPAYKDQKGNVSAGRPRGSGRPQGTSRPQQIFNVK